MRLIFTHENIAVLHSVKNILSLNGIGSIVKNEHTIPNGARHGIDNIFLELWIINDKDQEAASSIIESEILNPQPKSKWVCAACQEKNEGGFELCWNCQTVHENVNE